MRTTPRLHWIRQAATKGFEVYELCNQLNETLMTLTINTANQSARFESACSRRIFKIEKRGFLKKKTILSNEYGVKIGELGQEGWLGQQYVIKLNDHTYKYSFSDHQEAELMLYGTNEEHPLLVCNMLHLVSHTFSEIKQQAQSMKLFGLLSGLCWYMFTPSNQTQNSSVQVAV